MKKVIFRGDNEELKSRKGAMKRTSFQEFMLRLSRIKTDFYLSSEKLLNDLV